MSKTNPNKIDDRCPLDPPVPTPTAPQPDPKPAPLAKPKRPRKKPTPPADLKLVKAIRTFDAETVREAAFDTILRFHSEMLDGEDPGPEALFNRAVRLAQLFRLAWVLDEPHHADMAPVIQLVEQRENPLTRNR